MKRTQTDDAMIGKTLGNYVITKLIGKGSISRVYSAQDASLDREVAIKVLNLDQDQAHEFSERLKREALTIGKLDHHPNIISLYQYGIEDNCQYIVMKLIRGRTLTELLAQLKRDKIYMSYPDVLNIMRQIASAVDFAHENGIVHRDIRPSNIMIQDGTGHVVLRDFGLVMNAAEARTLGTAFGNPRYISPEQAMSSQYAIPQSDIYSLGVVLFEMLAGRVPFDQESPMEMALSHITSPPLSPLEIRVDLPSAVADVVLKALEKQPENRFQTAHALMVGLEQALGNLPMTTLPPAEPPRPQSSSQNKKPILKRRGPDTLGRYQLVELVGEGRTGDVYKAYQPRVDRHVALKVLHSFLTDLPEVKAHLENQVSVTSKIQHVNLLKVFDFGYANGKYYVVREFIDGPSVDDKLRELAIQNERFSLEEVVNIATDVVSGLAYAHHQNSLYPNLNPNKLLLHPNGHTILIPDSGMIQLPRPDSFVTKRMNTLTAFNYRAPEIQRGLQGDPRSDLYSLGVILYEMVTGQLPYDLELSNPSLDGFVPNPQAIRPETPEWMAQILMQLINKQPEARYQVADALLEILADKASTAPKVALTGNSVHDIFISYSRKDREFMERFVDTLKGHNFSIWTDHHLDRGATSFAREIKNAINRARLVVVICSPDAEQSEWVENEIALAQSYGRVIFPLWMRGTELEAIPARLISYHRYDVRDNYEDGIRKLIAAIRERLDEP